MRAHWERILNLFGIKSNPSYHIIFTCLILDDCKLVIVHRLQFLGS